MGRFDNLVNTSFTPTQQFPSATGRFDSVVSTGGRFDSLTGVETGIKSFLSKGVKKVGGAFGKVGRVLSAGQQATTGLVEKGLEKAKVLKPTDSGPIQAVKTQRSNVDLLRRIGEERGGGVLTGQYTPSTSVFGNFIKEVPSVLSGTLADIFVDPLFVFGKAGTVAKTTGKAGEIIKKGATRLAEESPAVQKIGDMLGKAFLTRYGQSGSFRALDVGRKIEESLVQEKVAKLTSDIIEKPAFIQQRIAQIIKGGITNDNELKVLAEPIREELDRVGESISKLNPKLLSEETFSANKGSYFPRLYTEKEFPNPEDVVNQLFPSRAVSVPKDPFMKRTLTEAESLEKGTRIEEAGFPALKRLTQLNIAETRQKFFSEVSKLASNEAKPGWIQLSDDKALGALAGKFLPAAEYNAIAQLRKVPSEYEKFFNKALTLWKSFKTAYNPSTITRNDLTNFFILNPLGGVGPHRLDVYARATQELLTKGPMYQLARKEGLNISTQQAAELTQQATRFYRANEGLIKQFFGKIGDFHEAVKNFYGSQDKFFKLANFIKGVTEDGMTPTEAMRRANFYLVDYSEVPTLIEWARKSPFGVPFISFTYGVSKPLAKTLLERPDKLAAYYKILNGIQSFNPLGETPQDLQREEDVLPEWIQNGTYLRLPVKDKIGRSQYVDLQYILPTNILETNNIKPSHPLLSWTSAIFNNKDPFFQKEIWNETDTDFEKAQKAGAYLLRQFFPSMTPIIGTSADKVWNWFQKRPDKTGFVKDQWQVFLDVLGGIKITPIDPTIEAQKRAYEKQRQLLDLKSQLRTIMLDKSLFPEEKQRQSEEVREKIKRATQ